MSVQEVNTQKKNKIFWYYFNLEDHAFMNERDDIYSFIVPAFDVATKNRKTNIDSNNTQVIHIHLQYDTIRKTCFLSSIRFISIFRLAHHIYTTSGHSFEYIFAVVRVGCRVHIQKHAHRHINSSHRLHKECALLSNARR